MKRKPNEDQPRDEYEPLTTPAAKRPHGPAQDSDNDDQPSGEDTDGEPETHEDGEEQPEPEGQGDAEGVPEVPAGQEADQGGPAAPALVVELPPQDDEPQLPVLTDPEIAALDLDQANAALTARIGDFDAQTEDRPALEFRVAALEHVDDAAWLLSLTGCRAVAGWLTTRAALTGDLLTVVQTRVGQLTLPATPAPPATTRGAIWTALNLARRLNPQIAAGEGCEYLAHAICEWFQAAHPNLARLHLTKYWIVAPNGNLHPPDNWNHHVAPVLHFADGDYVFDLSLFPNGPTTLAAWRAATRTQNPPAGLDERQSPWELLLPPAIAPGYQPGMRAVIGDMERNAIDACTRV
ncbi:protein-glutamine glutaminase family protein [Embleya hyalina]|uniref:Protein glutaminase domain-containing protein n=1 Tax=Embleya hyalina TaxID=516124 RepID=A0A401Z559_9ACTN|nr:protein-glutamine glutaminase family protein [Embleya hyalina]GCE01991.1 hypothetical protein EHYA_09766 [Embleya hyalina]